MCKLAIVLKEPGADMATLSDALTAQYSTIAKEPDGIGATIVGLDNSISIDRKLDTEEYEGVFDRFIESLAGAKIGVIHTRFATIGEKNLHNVHQYKHNGQIFAHNGHVGAFSGWGEGATKAVSTSLYAPVNIVSSQHLGAIIRSPSWYASTVEYKTERKHAVSLYDELCNKLLACTECDGDIDRPCTKHQALSIEIASLDSLLVSGKMGKVSILGAQTGKTKEIKVRAQAVDSDSLLFLKKLGTLSIKSIEKAMATHKFSGIASLIDTKSNSLYLLGTRDYKVQRGNGWVIIYSFEPVASYKKYEYAFGLPVVGSTVSINTSTMPDDVYHIDYSGVMALDGAQSNW